MSNFDLGKLGKMKYIVVESNEGDMVKILYSSLKLVVVNGQLCFNCSVLNGEDIDLYMPIARKSTIDKLFGDEK